MTAPRPQASPDACPLTSRIVSDIRQRMKSIALVLELLALNAFALNSAHSDDPGLNQLRQSFSAQLQAAPAFWDKAAEMKPIITSPGKPITADECSDLATKIAANYKVNPFHFIFENGSSENGMCGGLYGYAQTFLLLQNGVSNLGLPYTTVVQLPDETGAALYFIDSSNRIVETEGQTVNKQTNAITSYGITAVDANGNISISVYDQNYEILGGDGGPVSGTHSMQEYVPADGSIPFPILRNSIKDSKNPANDYETIRLSRADAKDWQDFQLPITFADIAGGYYSYGGKYYDTSAEPVFQSFLVIRYRGGKEVCASGYVEAKAAWTYLPSDNNAREYCENY
jgi:hypothetical protein